MAALVSFHADKCCYLVIEHEASAWLHMHTLMFMISSTVVLVS